MGRSSARSAADRRAAWKRGLHAESVVAEHLEADGWRVLDRNWHARGGELDLVVERDGAVRFVEVRARKPADPTGLESVNRTKRRRLVRAAEAWLLAHAEPLECAFMVAVVSLAPDGWRVSIVDDAFDAEGS